MFDLFLKPAQLTSLIFCSTLTALVSGNADLLRHAPQCGVTGSQIGCEAERQTRNMRSVICFGLIRFLISKGF